MIEIDEYQRPRHIAQTTRNTHISLVSAVQGPVMSQISRSSLTRTLGILK